MKEKVQKKIKGKIRKFTIKINYKYINRSLKIWEDNPTVPRQAGIIETAAATAVKTSIQSPNTRAMDRMSNQVLA